MEFAIASGVDVGKGRAGGDESLGVGDALGGAEDFEELIALAANAAEEAGLLEDECPGDEGGEEQNGEYAASDPTGLRDDFKNIADENGS